MNDDIKYFKTINSHKVFVSGESTPLFNESEKDDVSITELIEQDIVKNLFKNDSIKEMIVNEITNLSSQEVEIKLEVSEPLLTVDEQKIIGDIDIVIIPKKNPELTVIIEVKKIKMTTLKEQIVKINKVCAIRKKGFTQIKKLLKFKYHKTFLCIIIEDDSRNMKSRNTFIRDSDSEEIRKICNINHDNKLEENAGLIIIKMTQPTGEHYNTRFNFGILIEKDAKQIFQNKLITKRVKKLI